MDILILTGQSGSGKTQASHTLEDLNCLCIENIPVELIPQIAEIYSQNPTRASRLVFVVDCRGESDFDKLLSKAEEIKAKGTSCKILFLTCAKDVLIRRYKENRRIHPLSASRGLTISEALEAESSLLSPLRHRADYVIDTTHLTPGQLHAKILSLFSPGAKNAIQICCVSFGFKNGVPGDADMVFDVRCFPNPYYIADLKPLTGSDAPVRDYVFSFPQSNEFFDKMTGMIDFLMPLFVEEGKSQLTVAIGCTGGHHRSVAFVDRLNRHLLDEGYRSFVIHRDVAK